MASRFFYNNVFFGQRFKKKSAVFFCVWREAHSEANEAHSDLPDDLAGPCGSVSQYPNQSAYRIGTCQHYPIKDQGGRDELEYKGDEKQMGISENRGKPPKMDGL